MRQAAQAEYSPPLHYFRGEGGAGGDTRAGRKSHGRKYEAKPGKREDTDWTSNREVGGGGSRRGKRSKLCAFLFFFDTNEMDERRQKTDEMDE